MKILVDQSGYRLDNVGDIAMLQVAVARLQHLWPQATVSVFADDPYRLARLCPGAVGVDLAGHTIWSSLVPARLDGWLPAPLAEGLARCEWAMRHQSPQILRRLLGVKAALGRGKAADLDGFVRDVEEADLVVSSGGGFITDAFAGHAIGVLGVLDLAATLGKPTAMFGQALGPISSSRLQKALCHVLPRLEVLALREKYTGAALAHAAGVSPTRLVVTGDDGIEPAYRARRSDLGHAIGINVRVAHYAQMTTSTARDALSPIVATAQRLGAPLLPLPIAHGTEHNDNRALQEAVGGDDGLVDVEPPNTPWAVIARTGSCRLVVTGSYHAAVFALAQGIPTIGLARSPYYVAKFHGLADLFGSGCQVVAMDTNGAVEAVQAAMITLWAQAPELRAPLLEAARRQIHSAQAAYTSLLDIDALGTATRDLDSDREQGEDLLIATTS